MNTGTLKFTEPSGFPLRLRSENVEISLEFKKVTCDETAISDTRSSRLRKGPLGKTPTGRKNAFGLRRLKKHMLHCGPDRGVKSVDFTGDALPIQTKGRRNLLLSDGGLRLAGGNFSVGRFGRRPDCAPRRQHS